MPRVLDEMTLANVTRLCNMGLIMRSLDLIQTNCVNILTCTGNYLEAQVTDQGRSYTLTIDAAADRTLHIACECGGMRDGPCLHVTAALVALVNRSQKEAFTGLGAELAPKKQARRAAPTLRLHPLQPELRTDWEKRLEALIVKDLRDIGLAWGVKVKGLRREEVLNGVLEAVMRPDGIDYILEHMRPDTRCVLDIFCAMFGVGAKFNRTQILPYLDATLTGVLDNPRPAQECLEDLRHLGMCLEEGSTSTHIPLQVVVQLPATTRLFKPLDSEPRRVSLVKPFQFTRLTLRLLLLAQGKLLRCASKPEKVSKSGWRMRADGDEKRSDQEILTETAYLPENVCSSLAARLNRPAELVDLAARMLEDRGLWARGAPEKAGAGASAWLARSPQQQSRELLAQFASFPTQIELDLARQTGFIPHYDARANLHYLDFLTALGRSRLLVVSLLLLAPAGEWLELESILRVIHALQPGWWLEFDLRQKNQSGAQALEKAPIWAVSGGRRLNPLVYEDWLKAYGHFHQVILTHSLHWLGLVDVAWREDRPVAVRISEFGEFLCERRADFELLPLQNDQPALIQLPDGTLELDPERADLGLIHLITNIADPVSDQLKKGSSIPDRLAYRLTNTGLCWAFESGLTLDEIVNRLQAASHTPIPADVMRQMEAYWDHFGRLQIYEDLALIEFGDDYCLPELLAGTRLSQILVYTFNPRLVAVRAAEIDPFLAELKTRGYTPRLMGGERA